MRRDLRRMPGDRFLARHLDRRGFLKLSGSVAAAAFLAACKKAETATGGPSGSPRPPVGQEPGDLKIFDWAGYEVKPLWRSYARQFPWEDPDMDDVQGRLLGVFEDRAEPGHGELRHRASMP